MKDSSPMTYMSDRVLRESQAPGPSEQPPGFAEVLPQEGNWHARRSLASVPPSRVGSLQE